MKRRGNTRCFDRAGRRGFTLVELLVVIAIISLLASLLLPALENAVREARLVSCMNGKKQISLGFSFYQNDYESYMLGGSLAGPKADAPVWDGKFVNTGTFIMLGYLDYPGVLSCTDHSLSGQFVSAAGSKVSDLLNGATVTGNVESTVVLNGPSTGGANTGFYPYQPIASNTLVWWNKVSRDQSYKEGIACKLSGNLPGGVLYYGMSRDKFQKRKVPSPLAMCAGTRGGGYPNYWKVSGGFSMHGNSAFTALHADGLVATYRLDPADFGYGVFFLNHAQNDWSWTFKWIWEKKYHTDGSR